MTRFARSKATTRPSTWCRRFRPWVEELETRLVPSTSIPLNPNSWVDIGPAPINTGQGVTLGPVSGRVTGLATDPNNVGTIYAATAGGGVWKTINGGNSWSPTMDNLSASGV